MSFEEFRRQLKSTEIESRDALNSNQVRAMSEVDVKEEAGDTNTLKVLQKLFKRKKNQKLRRLEDVVGPLYIDPKVNDKLENPRKCMQTMTRLRYQYLLLNVFL